MIYTLKQEEILLFMYKYKYSGIILRGCLVCCDVPLMWCTLRKCDIKIFGLFNFFLTLS